jgi:DNA repair protein RadC
MQQTILDLGIDHDVEPFTMACNERPQARMENFGVSALSDTELVAMILQGGGTTAEAAIDTARRLVAEAGSIAGLATWTAADYRRHQGIGPGKGRQLAAVAEIARRMIRGAGERPLLDRPESVAAYLRPMVTGLQVEKFWVLCLNRRNRLLKQVELTSGTATATLAHPREVFRTAIRESAVAISCVHNLCAAPHRLCYVACRAM